MTRMVSISRDNIMHMVAQPDFFEKNPQLISVKESMDACRAAFEESAKKQGCRCRADTNLLFKCISTFINTLEEAKTTNPEIVHQFVRYVAKADDIANTKVTIYYVPPNSSTPARYVFP